MKLSTKGKVIKIQIASRTLDYMYPHVTIL